jgi:hypothetical protein
MLTASLFLSVARLGPPIYSNSLTIYSATSLYQLFIMSRLLWQDGITDLAITQIDLSTQALPAFWWGLFATEKTDVHPWCICASTMISTVYVICFNYLYVQHADNPLSINAGVTGFVLQIFLTIMMEGLRRLLDPSKPTEPASEPSMDDISVTRQNAERIPRVLFPNRPAWDIPTTSKFGVHALSPKFLWKMMEGVTGTTYKTLDIISLHLLHNNVDTDGTGRRA